MQPASGHRQCDGLRRSFLEKAAGPKWECCVRVALDSTTVSWRWCIREMRTEAVLVPGAVFRLCEQHGQLLRDFAPYGGPRVCRRWHNRSASRWV